MAQYDPPYTLPYFRRNEVWIDLHTLDENVSDKFPVTPKLLVVYQRNQNKNSFVSTIVRNNLDDQVINGVINESLG